MLSITISIVFIIGIVYSLIFLERIMELFYYLCELFFIKVFNIKE